MATKNVFANMAADSDDEFEAKPMTKTGKKKEDRKITEKEAPAKKPVQVNESKMQEGGFEMSGQINQKGRRPQTGRGGRDGDRGGRGGRGRGRGDRGGGQFRTNEQGDQVFDPEKRQGGRFQGKPRDAHPYDRHSGAGRGTRKPDEKKGGFGRGNWGGKPDRAYKQGKVDEEVPEGETPQKPVKEEAAAEPKKEKPPKVEEEKVVEEETEEIILGVSLDDFLATQTQGKQAQARAAEGITGVKVKQGDNQKVEKLSTVNKKDVSNVGKKGGHELLGFTNAADDDDEGMRGGGARRGGRGGRGGRPDRQNQPPPAKRGDAKKALKRMSEEDFPAL